MPVHSSTLLPTYFVICNLELASKLADILQFFSAKLMFNNNQCIITDVNNRITISTHGGNKGRKQAKEPLSDYISM